MAVSGVLSQLLDKRPFVPFEVVLADGRIIKISTNEQAWLEGEAELLYVVRLKPADEPMTEIVAVKHVAMIRVSERMMP